MRHCVGCNTPRPIADFKAKRISADGLTKSCDLGTPAAKAVVEATLVAAQQAIAKDAAITADLVITGGSAPTLSHITVLLVFGRRG